MRRLPGRIAFLLVTALALAAPVGMGEASAAPAKARAKAVRAGARKSVKRKVRLVCKGKGKQRRCRRVGGGFAGHGVAAADLRAEPLPRPSGRIRIHSAALGESVEVAIFKADGSYDEAALARLDNLFRCRSTHEVHAVDPRLYEVLSLVQDHFGRPVSLTSGFRYQRNEGSRHFHASAMDIRIDGVDYREIYRFAESLDRGGMGIGQYPGQGFVHIDFRAPGEKSYRWTDTSTRSSGADGRKPDPMWQARRKPNS